MLEKRSFTLSGHRTSIALEAEFWTALAITAAVRGVALAALIGEVDSARAPGQPLASALRVFVLKSK
jgi:predicted DNA-binding ribbon-helix-helix protein